MTARIRWFDKRDGEGIAVDATDREFYFNRSVPTAAPCPDFYGDLADGIQVWIQEWDTLGQTRCVTLFG